MRRILLLLATLALGGAAAWGPGDAYVLHSGQTDVTRTSASVKKLVALRQRLAEIPSYLWVRLGSREYLIRDEVVLREAVALWAPIEAMKPEQEAVDEEERRLDTRIDAIEDRKATPAEGELDQLRARDRVIGQRQRELDEQEQAIEADIEAKLMEIAERAIRSGRAEDLQQSR